MGKFADEFAAESQRDRSGFGNGEGDVHGAGGEHPPSASRTARGNRKARPHKVRNESAVNSGENTASSVISDAGTGNAASGSISGELVHDRQGARPAATAPAIMDSVPQTPDQQARDAVTARITARVTVGWPRLGEPVAGYRGQYCYVAALLPGHREATPILRLRWQGCAGDRAIGICKASTGHYSETELPGAFAGATGTPGQGIGETFILYAGPGTGN